MVYIVCDQHGAQWIVQPRGAGDPQIVGDDVVERAVIGHGFDRIERSFETWERLDAERQRRAGLGLAAVQIDVEHFDAEDVQQMMRALGRCRQRDQIPQARRVAHRLLRAPVIRQNLDLYRDLVAFLDELDEIPVPRVSTTTSAEPDREPARARVLSLTG